MVAAMDSIQVLSSSILAALSVTLFLSYLLMVGFTFRFHGIKDGDEVYIVWPGSANRVPPAQGC
jgi:hypothetical protein